MSENKKSEPFKKDVIRNFSSDLHLLIEIPDSKATESQQEASNFGFSDMIQKSNMLMKKQTPQFRDDDENRDEHNFKLSSGSFAGSKPSPNRANHVNQN